MNVSASFVEMFSKHSWDFVSQEWDGQTNSKTIIPLARFQQCRGIKLKKRQWNEKDTDHCICTPRCLFSFMFLWHTRDTNHFTTRWRFSKEMTPCGSIINWKRLSGLFWFCLRGIWHKHFHTGSIRREQHPSYFASPNATMTLIWKSHLKSIWSRI